MILRDFYCAKCTTNFEEFEPSGEETTMAAKEGKAYAVIRCPQCGTRARRSFDGKAALWCENIVPTYPGCKRQKAGYVHTSHADQNATKLQSGYGGCQAPRN